MCRSIEFFESNSLFRHKTKKLSWYRTFFGCVEFTLSKKKRWLKIVTFFWVELILTLSRILFSPFYDYVEILEKKKYLCNNKFDNYKSLFCNSFETLVDGVQQIACSIYWSSDILPDANDINKFKSINSRTIWIVIA